MLQNSLKNGSHMASNSWKQQSDSGGGEGE